MNSEALGAEFLALWVRVDIGHACLTKRLGSGDFGDPQISFHDAVSHAAVQLCRRSWRSESRCSTIELGTTKAGVSTFG